MFSNRFVCSNEIAAATFYCAGKMISISRFYPCLHYLRLVIKGAVVSAVVQINLYEWHKDILIILQALGKV